MTSTLQTALTVGPLACYFLVLGIWQCRRSPRVVSGQIDFVLPAVALGGLITTGPVADWLIRAIFPAPSIWASMALPSFYCLLVLLRLPRMARRVVVYNIADDVFRTSVDDAVQDLPLAMKAAPQGYEELGGPHRIRLEHGAASRIGLIEVRGPRADQITYRLIRELRARLREAPAAPTRLARLWFALALFVLAGPTVGRLLERPQIRAALQMLREHIVR